MGIVQAFRAMSRGRDDSLGGPSTHSIRQILQQELRAPEADGCGAGKEASWPGI